MTTSIVLTLDQTKNSHMTTNSNVKWAVTTEYLVCVVLPNAKASLIDICPRPLAFDDLNLRIMLVAISDGGGCMKLSSIIGVVLLTGLEWVAMSISPEKPGHTNSCLQDY